MKGLVFDIQRGSLTNGPGIRTTVFLKGCPLDCEWCHNPESKSFHVQLRPGCGHGNVKEMQEELKQFTGGSGIPVNRDLELVLPKEKSRQFFSSTDLVHETIPLVGRWMGVGEIMDRVLRDLKYYQDGLGGLTISGGEPFAQPAFLLSLLKAAKSKEIHTCVDTSGFCKEKHLRDSMPWTDLYLFDYKLSTPGAYKKYTGRDNGTILQNLKILVQNGANVILRCPIIPGINNTQQHLRAINEVFMENQGILGVQLMPYENYWLGKYPEFRQKDFVKDILPMGRAELEEMEGKLKDLGVPLL